MSLPPIKVVITGDADSVERAARDAERSLKGLRSVADSVATRFAVLGSRLQDLGRKMSVVSAGVVAGGGAMFLLASRAQQAGDKINDLAGAAGVSTGYFQKMTFALEQAAAMTDEETSAAMARLTKVIGEAADGSKSAGEALQKLGFSAEDAASGTITTEEAMDRFVSTVGEMKSPTEAAALAAELLGKSGQKAGTMLAGTGNAVSNLKDRAERLGVVLSEDSLQAAGKFGDQMDEVKRQFEALQIKIGAEILPLFTDYLIPVLQKKVIPAVAAVAASIGDWVQWFMDLPEPVKDAVSAIATGFALGGPVLIALGATATAISTLIAAIGPVGLFIAAAAALTAAWVKWGDDIKAAVGGAIDYLTKKFNAFLSFMDTLISKATAVKDAIAAALALSPETAKAVGVAVGGAYISENSGDGRMQRGSLGRDGGVVGGQSLMASSVAGFAVGMTDELTSMQNRAVALAQGVVDAVKTHLGIHSPSTVFEEIGRNVAQGFSAGMTGSAQMAADAANVMANGAVTGTTEAVSAILDSMSELFTKSKGIALAQAAVNMWLGATEALKLPFPENKAVGVAVGSAYTSENSGDGRMQRGSLGRDGGVVGGQSLMASSVAGFAIGMTDELTSMQDRAVALAQGVVDAVKTHLGIHSPPTVFEEIGRNVAQGFSAGMTGSAQMAADAANVMANGAVTGTTEAVSAILDSMSELFTKSKGIALAQAAVNMWQGATEALKLPFPENLVAWSKVLALGSKAISGIKGASASGSGGGGSGSSPSAAAELPVQRYDFAIQGPPAVVASVQAMFDLINQGARQGLRVDARVISG